MDFVVTALVTWLLEQLANAGRHGLVTFALGDKQERALRSAVGTAIQLTARGFFPNDDTHADQLADVIGQIFGDSVKVEPLAGADTLLQALQAGIAARVARLDDPELTGTGRSSAEWFGVSAAALAETLMANLIGEVISRAARGGALEPLATQLNADVTHLQGQQIISELRELVRLIRDELPVLLGQAPAAGVQPAQVWAAPAGDSGGTKDFFGHLIASHTALFAGRDQERARILEFIKTRGTGYVFVEALSGYGKTSLLAYLVSRHPEFCYHFISQAYKRGGSGFDPTQRSGLVRNLYEQLAPGRVPTDDLQGLESQFQRLLSEPPSKPRTVVVDAIDEIERPGDLWGLLPPKLPEGLVIILSARTQGDRSALQDVGLSIAQMSVHLELTGLDEAAFVKLLELAGGAARPLARDRNFVARLHQVSRGDPFYVRFLVEDVAAGVLSGANVDQAPSGLAAYLDLQLEMLDRSANRPQHAEILGFLLENDVLSREDLLLNVKGLTWLNFYSVMREIHRFLLVHDDQYTFCHDRFRDYFRAKAGMANRRAPS